ncbi:hypothetical protein MTR67_022428 [Solanum verrucosum]|uniref:RNase H type-1 domain-containing protein n=1 Tax=Solanum verrucosum TaxID=315347 RepID=A0AAF0QVB6_SOLVR|nr:hypothetical protein MTR67_022428 [Solanum verrucosum]
MGFDIQGLQITQVINLWWDAPTNPHVRYIFQAVPAIILWELRKRRNAIKHGGKMSHMKLMYQVMHTIVMFMKVRSNFKYAPYEWSELVQVLQVYTPKLKVRQVLWKPPERGCIKCNTNGASRGNPGRSSWSFCVRNHSGNIIHAQAQEMEDTNSTNTQAEAMAILQALKFINNTQSTQVIIETDSVLLEKVIHKTWEVPWQIVNVMGGNMGNYEQL